MNLVLVLTLVTVLGTQFAARTPNRDDLVASFRDAQAFYAEGAYDQAIVRYEEILQVRSRLLDTQKISVSVGSESFSVLEAANYQIGNAYSKLFTDFSRFAGEAHDPERREGLQAQADSAFARSVRAFRQVSETAANQVLRVQAFGRLVDLYFEAERYFEVIEAADAMIAAYPGEPRAVGGYYNRGWAFYEKWINRNGDGFGDQKPWSAEAGFADLIYGHTEAPNFKYSIYVTDWGWVSLPANGLDNVNFGYVLGQDGSGLFNFQPKQAPLTWPQFTIIVNDDTNWDGVFLAVGGIQDEAAANDWIPADTPLPNTYPIAHWPYDQKRVNLGTMMTAVTEQKGNTPDTYELGNAYPNPFNPETTIRFSLPWSVDVKIDVFNDQGQLVRTLVDETLNAGQFEVTWDGTDNAGHQVASGVYIYKINAPNLSLSKKVTFLK